MFRRLFLLLVVCGTIQTARAQYFGFGQLFIQMIFSWEEGGYEAKHTWFNDEPAYLHGLRGGWYVNQDNTLLLGFSMYAGSTTINEQFSLYSRQRFTTFYSTLFMSKTYRADQPIQIEVLGHVGYGFAQLEALGFGAPPTSYSGYLLLEPNVNASFALGNICRIGAGIGYRQLGKIRLNGADTYSLSGPSLNAFIKFGRFR
ncbi:MAG TPA: hypothetical protein DEP18_06175 [Flavobacteriales bacterium]|nr:hypothetical protein [Flavobacteriales bacterium]HCA83356.1 hypothetical protein [Flavobacteriales bacterium]HRE75713.1 hypothetical protein [Flavobacteriales bacterium]HRE95986.1 hypothetical protein [Flavobacteriales bacterium]HRJ34832.1 hypothetical protein [Flavobacteriales bacterium]